MASYATLDYILDLSADEIASAIDLPLKPSSDGNGLQGIVTGNGAAPYLPVYKFNLNEGAEYIILDISFFDPYLRVYDASGNAINTNSESVDSAAEILYYDYLHFSDGGAYSVDTIPGSIAPYTGTYYVKPGWEQGNYYKVYSLFVSSDNTQPPPTPVISDTDRVYNWAEHVYPTLFTEHQESQADVFGYYARIYSSGDALGEKDGSVFYYDGGSGGSGDIVQVGLISDFIAQAAAAGY